MTPQELRAAYTDIRNGYMRTMFCQWGMHTKKGTWRGDYLHFWIGRTNNSPAKKYYLRFDYVRYIVENNISIKQVDMWVDYLHSTGTKVRLQDFVSMQYDNEH